MTHHSLHSLAFINAAAIVLATHCTAHASETWVFTDLHPPGSLGFEWSRAYGCDGTEVVGSYFGDALPGETGGAFSVRGCVWHASNIPVATFPSGVYQVGTELLSVSNGQYIGSRSVPEYPAYPGATLWTGHNNSWINLRPAAATRASGNAVHNGQQVGLVYINNVTKACIWTGDPETWIDLSPPGWPVSEAYDVFEGQQVGGAADYSSSIGIQHAGLWHGSAESWVDLHPTHEPSLQASYARGTSREQQVGLVAPGDTWFTGRPALWTGTARSFVDLMPVGGGSPAEAYAVAGGWQVGHVTFAGNPVASLWHGSSQSWVNLQQFMPPDTIESIAYDVWTDGRTLRIVGTRNTTGSLVDDHAFLLTRTLPCAADLDNDGSLANGGTPDNAVDINDLLFFLQAFEAGALAADLDNNGDPAATIPDNAVDINDLLFFLARFEGGC